MIGGAGSLLPVFREEEEGSMPCDCVMPLQ